MNYEKIILDLYERVVSLEEKVTNLENRLSLTNLDQTRNLEDNSINSSEKITRNISRKYVMDKLSGENPAFLITKGNRAAKADILLKTTENEVTYILKAKFYHSKSFNDFPSGWHTVNEDELTNEDLHLFIFNIEFEKQFYTFLFSRTELLSFVNNKSIDQNHLYHFYFHVVHDQAVEVRDEEKDASIYYNRWKLPSFLMKK
ncbi:hypothetical protein [Paenibacillus sp. MER 99-2]|uniref:hypothetical protein n=1 Tax=Paenibacillus sp. MER 99-2 TaxID=2939572 RepID=UPI00203F9625|nr:hypothetical protein [Paenibacillus sp. MER 99-2]MCM3175942.1 hypothetical protein [Paenibacillus sp. MER 99-2]